MYLIHGMLSVSPAPHTHIALLFWSPLDSPLSSGHQSSLWESVSRSKILSVALDCIACLVMTLFPDSTLVLLGLLGALDFSSCAYRSWDEPPVSSSLGFTYIPCMSCSLTLVLHQPCLRAGLVAYCTCMAMKKEAAKITLKSEEQWRSHENQQTTTVYKRENQQGPTVLAQGTLLNSL